MGNVVRVGEVKLGAAEGENLRKGGKGLPERRGCEGRSSYPETKPNQGSNPYPRLDAEGREQ